MAERVRKPRKRDKDTPVVEDDGKKYTEEASTVYDVGELKKQRERKPSDHITAMQEAFIEYYVRTLNRKEAALLAGYSPRCAGEMARRLLNGVYYPLVEQKIRKLLQARQQDAAMDGAAILRFIHAVIQFKPADWFVPGSDGGWVVDRTDYHVMPDSMKMIIEEVKATTVQLPDSTTTTMLNVKFISKTAMLALAAKYQLGDRVMEEQPQAQIDWSELFGRQPKQLVQVKVIGTSALPTKSDAAWNDPIEAEITNLEAGTKEQHE
jgi:hypothetical protein